MESLHKDWLTENHIDFEYKKYVLLAYLTAVEAHYKQTQVYPWLAELIQHYRQLEALRNNTESLQKGFQKEMKGFDWQKFQIVYEELGPESEVLEELKQIIGYSIPLFQQYIQDGKKIYDFVEHNLELKPVGISPLQNNEGYLLISNLPSQDVHIYRYALSLYEDAHEKMKSLSTDYLDSREAGWSDSYENIKLDLIKQHKDLPNPAVYAIESKVEVPLKETLLPIAKRYFVSKACC